MVPPRVRTIERVKRGMGMKIADTSAQDVAVAPQSQKKKWIIGGVATLLVMSALGVLASGYTSWASTDISIARDRLRVAAVTQGDLTRDLSLQGRVVAAVSPKLYSPYQGTINYQVTAGDSVEVGHILAYIDSPELTNQLKQEEANLQRLQIELERKKIDAKQQALQDQKAVDLARVALSAAEREKRRADSAFQHHSISEIDFEKAQDDLENATLEHQHAVSDADLNRELLSFEVRTSQLQVDRQSLLVADLQRKVEELTVRSPVSGIVGNLAVEQKNQVAQNQDIVSVVDLSEFELEVLVPEGYADDLAIGMETEVIVDGNKRRATLVTISPEIIDNQVTARVRFSDGHVSGLRQNQRLTTRILIENKPNVLMVQRGQFLESGSGRIAYIVRGDIATKASINTGARSLSDVEILSGLNAGDQIIISSTDAFRGAETVLLTQ